ncbi:SdpI family protein [Cnuibacter sp. UC19_7]|uniref:SdpI family protein n=1 Tax=Cnuibacter sp. UC19_7 TaxID=3350166 RepID=UPI00366C8CE8
MTGVVLFPLLLLLVAVLTQLAAAGVLGKNRVVGIRIGSTLRSPAAWTAGHRAAAPWTWAGFALGAVAALGALLSTGSTAAVLAAIVVAMFVATIVMSLVSASRGARAASRPTT